MPLKIFRAMWFLSVLLLFAALLYGYAGWQEVMIIQDDGAGNPLSMNREVLFYLLVAVFVMVNVLVYLISKVFAKQENFRAWFHGLMITINIFFIIAMSLIGLYNSSENFNYSRIGFVVYGSVGLMIAWALAWPIYLLFQKVFIKQAV